MTYATEFPDFPAADMPALPEGFADTSWHNDACPSYSSPAFQIMIDYLDQAQREHPTGSRFTVIPSDLQEGDDDPLETDDWSEVLQYVTDAATFESICAKQGLSILTDDSEPRCGRMFHIMQGDRRLKVAYSKDEARDFILSRKDAQ
jgi:hypothetical protein